MRRGHATSEAGFTLVELTIVVVISTMALIAIYQTLITQERTYRYQSAAIDTQGATRVGLQVLGAELREMSASAGSSGTKGGSDLLAATRDSVRFRAFRKVGITCSVNAVLGTIDVWVPGAPFEVGDTLLLFQEGNITSDEDDTWAAGRRLRGVGTATNAAACADEWGSYTLQALQGMDPVDLLTLRRGALIRSYNTLTYGAARWEDEWVLARWGGDGSVVPLVGPLLSPDSGGIAFRYFDQAGTELTPSSNAVRARVARIEITVRALSRGGIDHQNHVDSLSTNIYLRGN